MIRYGNGNRTTGSLLLHDDMAASFAYFYKTVSGRQDSANFPA